MVTEVDSDYCSWLCRFIKAKSELSLEDVGALVEIGLELFNISQNKLYVQVLHHMRNNFFSCFPSFSVFFLIRICVCVYVLFLCIRLDGEIS